jgi:hypothetical protein
MEDCCTVRAARIPTSGYGKSDERRITISDFLDEIGLRRGPTQQTSRASIDRLIIEASAASRQADEKIGSIEKETKMTQIILVGSDKGGVGKSTVSRCLLDYLKNRGVAYRAFDTQAPNGDLVRFNYEAKITDIASIEGQMEVFDGVIDDTVTVVDICAGQLTPTIQALDDAKLLEDVRAGSVKLVLMHVLGPTMASISEVASVARTIGGAKHLLVKNHVNQTRFFEWDNGGASAIFEKYADVTINVSQLPERACEELQQKGGTFVDYTVSGPSRTLRGHVSTWLSNVWAEFERVGALN